jgi:hypothetical protein
MHITNCCQAANGRKCGVRVVGKRFSTSRLIINEQGNIRDRNMKTWSSGEHFSGTHTGKFQKLQKLIPSTHFLWQECGKFH